MKRFFFIALGITSGLLLAISIVAGGAYWWLEIREPPPPRMSVEVDGFPKPDDSKVQLRIVITNHENSKIALNDVYLYLTRVSDEARINYKFDINNMVLYPNEKIVEIVGTLPVKGEWVEFKGKDEFDSELEYLTHRDAWVAQLKENYPFNFSIISEEHGIRILLDVQKKIKEIEFGKSAE